MPSFFSFPLVFFFLAVLYCFSSRRTEAVDRRDNLAAFMYEQLFTYVVNKINAAIALAALGDSAGVSRPARGACAIVAGRGALSGCHQHTVSTPLAPPRSCVGHGFPLPYPCLFVFVLPSMCWGFR
jgi:hypothetical protein